MRISVVLLLIRTYLKGTKPIRALIERISFGKKKSVKMISGIALTLLMGFSLAMFLFLMGINFYNYQMVGLMVGKPNVGVLLGLAFGTISVLIFSAPAAINILHGAKDIERLRALAIGEGELALSRLIIFYLHFAPVYLFFVLPSLTIGMMTGGFSLFYLLSGILLLLFGPIIPILIATLLEIGVVHLTKGRRAQRSGELIYLVIMMAFVIGLTSQMGKNADMVGDLQGLTHQLTPVIAKLVRILAPFTFQVYGLENPIFLLLWLALTLVFCYITFTIVSTTYSTSCSLLASSGYQTKKRRRNNTHQSRPTLALMKRDWTILLSFSGFIFELGGELLIPLILIITYSAMGIMGDISSATKALAEFPLFEPVVVLVLLMFANMSLLSSTSVSRQGKLALNDRLYPLEPQIFVNAKLYLHVLLVGSANLLYLLAATLIFNFALARLGIYIVLSLLSIIGTSFFHLGIDYRNPLLEWTSAQQAMKRNPNGLIGILVSFLFVLWIGVFLVGLPYFFKLAQASVHAITLIVAFATTKVAQRLAYKSAIRFLA